VSEGFDMGSMRAFRQFFDTGTSSHAGINQVGGGVSAAEPLSGSRLT
jgi:hypothetical protein